MIAVSPFCSGGRTGLASHPIETPSTLPVVVLLHAFPQSSAMWLPQIKSLASQCQVIAPDFPGFGGSSRLAGMSVDTMADDVASLLDRLGITEPVVLGGCSMGGYVAFAFARRHPGRLRGLILADTKPEADDDAAKATRNTLLQNLQSGAVTPKQLTETMLPKLLGETTRNHRPVVVTEVLRIGSAQSTAGVADAVIALRDRPDACAGLAKITVPTLVIVGEHDAVTPAAGARATAERIAGSQCVVIPEAGHLANQEQPELFNRAVLDFLSRTISG